MCSTLLFSKAPRRAAINNHNASVGYDKRGIQNIAAIFAGKVLCFAFKQVGILSDFNCLQLVIQFFGCCMRTKRQQQAKR